MGQGDVCFDNPKGEIAGKDRSQSPESAQLAQLGYHGSSTVAQSGGSSGLLALQEGVES